MENMHDDIIMKGKGKYQTCMHAQLLWSDYVQTPYPTTYFIITVVTGSNPQPQGIDNHSLSDQNTPFARSLINSKL